VANVLEENNSRLIQFLKDKSNALVGKGYGEFKDKQIRIANFPAIKSKEIDKLAKFLNRNVD
jgi:phosphoserine aminotransferase